VRAKVKKRGIVMHGAHTGGSKGSDTAIDRVVIVGGGTAG
jgi:hypothetical protein